MIRIRCAVVLNLCVVGVPGEHPKTSFSSNNLLEMVIPLTFHMKLVIQFTITIGKNNSQSQSVKIIQTTDKINSSTT